MKKKICKPLYSFRKYFFGTFVSNANVFQLIDPFLFDLVSRVFQNIRMEVAYFIIAGAGLVS